MRTAALALLLALLAFAAFGPALGNGFVSLDDPAYVTGNPPVLRGVTGEGLAWALTARHAANWHPLTWVSHMADVEVHGIAPRGHHLTSLLLHAGAVVGLFVFLARATGALWPSFLAAALFGAHPLRVESVAWVAERKDVLAAALAMLALLAWLGYARRPSRGRFLAALAAFALGLTAKGTLLALPALLLILDLWPLGRRRGAGAVPWRTLIAEKALLALPALGALALTLRAQAAAGMISPLPLAQRAANAAANHLEYLAGAVWPAALWIPHLLPEGGAAPGAIAGGVALLLAGSAAAWALRRRAPYAAAGWAWYLVAFLPTIGFVQLVNQSVADRYTYLPHAGLAAVVAWALAAPRRTRVRVAGVAAGLAAAVLLAAASRAQTRVWRDDLTLFGHAAALDPGNDMARINLGTALLNAGRAAEAEAPLRTLLARRPTFVPARLRLASALLDLGRAAEAAAVLEPAVAREPLDVDARSRLALALVRSGRGAEARRHLDVALRLRPDAPEALEAAAELRLPGYSPPPSSAP